MGSPWHYVKAGICKNNLAINPCISNSSGVDGCNPDAERPNPNNPTPSAPVNFVNPLVIDTSDPNSPHPTTITPHVCTALAPLSFDKTNTGQLEAYQISAIAIETCTAKP